MRILLDSLKQKGLYCHAAAASSIGGGKASVSEYQQGIGVSAGFYTSWKRLALEYEAPTLWSYRFGPGWGRLDIDLELSAAYWRTSRQKAARSMWQFGATPLVRWWPADAWYLEVGSGPAVLTKSVFSGRNLGMRFQFMSHFGAGVLFQKRHQLGIRYTHLSNSSIKKHNPGLDAVAVTYRYRF